MEHMYYLRNDKTGEITATSDIEAWERHHFEYMSRNIVKTEICGDISVSTVFLGLNHNYFGGQPILFETMVFGGPLDGEQERYETEAQARHGHVEMLRRVIEVLEEVKQ